MPSKEVLTLAGIKGGTAPKHHWTEEELAIVRRDYKGTSQSASIMSKLTPAQLKEFKLVDWGKYRGYIIGEITITDEVTFDDIGMKVTHSPWFVGVYGFVVKDGVLYETPIPCRGQPGFFEVDIEGIPQSVVNKHREISPSPHQAPQDLKSGGI